MLSGSLSPLQFGARDQDHNFLLLNGGGTDKGGRRRPKRGEVRREEKSEEKRRLEPKMSDGHSEGEDSVGHDFVDTTGDREVELRLPQEVDMDPDRPREDIQTHYRGSLPRVRLISVRRSSVVSSPQTGPNRNGPDTGCRCLSIWNHVDSRLWGCSACVRAWNGPP